MPVQSGSKELIQFIPNGSNIINPDISTKIRIVLSVWKKQEVELLVGASKK